MNSLLTYLLLFVMTSVELLGQDIDYARKIVNDLASEKMKGRGYVGNGDQLAAGYIFDEFERLSLISFGDSFVQPFKTAVNTFPSEMKVSLDDQDLIPGVDFLIVPGSPSVSGTFKVITLSLSDILSENALWKKIEHSKHKFISVDQIDRTKLSKEELIKVDSTINFLKYSEKNSSEGTIINTNELTWGVSLVLNYKPTIIFKTVENRNQPKQISLDIVSSYIENYSTQNLIGYVKGIQSDSLIVFTAHYDHLGMMGKETMFPGANDNASGVAMLLSLAKYYSINGPKYNTIFIAFGGEELGLLGSKFFVENPLFNLKKIKFLINHDIAGTGDDGIQVVNGSVFKSEFEKLSKINNEKKMLAQVKIRGEACNSDHCLFYMKGIPCFFIYTLGGIQAYHDIYDKPETLPLTGFEDYFNLMIRFVDQL